MQKKLRARFVGQIAVLFLGCLFNLNISIANAQSIDDVIKLADDVEVRRLADGVWLHTTYFDIDGLENVPANGLIVIDGKDAMMIDLPWTDKQTNLLFDWVTKEHQAVVQRVVPTHSHIDCAGGLAEAHRRKAESFALDKTVEILKRTKKTIPQNWFSERLCLGCGDINVELAFLGAGHTIDNIVTWIPKRKILFGGCMVKSLNAKNLGNTSEADLDAWPKTLKSVRETYSEAKIVIPGHGQPGGLDLIDRTIGLCKNIR